MASKEYDHGETVTRSTGQVKAELREAGFSDETANSVAAEHSRISDSTYGSAAKSGAPGPMAMERDGTMVARNPKFPA